MEQAFRRIAARSARPFQRSTIGWLSASTWGASIRFRSGANRFESVCLPLAERERPKGGPPLKPPHPRRRAADGRPAWTNPGGTARAPRDIPAPARQCQISPRRAVVTKRVEGLSASPVSTAQTAPRSPAQQGATLSAQRARIRSARLRGVFRLRHPCRCRSCGSAGGRARRSLT